LHEIFVRYGGEKQISEQNNSYIGVMIVSSSRWQALRCWWTRAPNGRPNSFSYGFWGSETSIRFPVVKLTDYRTQSEMLETSNNPFALATLAHFETQQTRKNAFMRFESKLRFTRSLYIRGWSLD
jgi:hypothetical protein